MEILAEGTDEYFMSDPDGFHFAATQGQEG